MICRHFSSGFFTFIMDRIPRKTMSKAKTYVVSSEVRLILCRKNDKWPPTTAYERVKQDLNILIKICGVFLGFLRNDNDDCWQSVVSKVFL